jgi:hypothetical protein
VLWVPNDTGLGEHVRSLVGRDLPKRAADDLLGVTEAVDRCGVDPVDSAFDGRPSRRLGKGVVLRTPGVDPAGTAERPRSDADPADGHAGAAERPAR